MSSSDNQTVPCMEWTGERMVPHASDAATELYHWQRYQFFRPWYEGAKVIDAASGEGYGANYASVLAQKVTGYDVCPEAVEHGNQRYPHVTFSVKDVCDADYTEADLVVSFETIEHLPDPAKFLQALATCQGRIVISTPNRDTHSPGNKLEDKPLNPYHTVEWTPSEFAELIRTHFPDRQVRFLSQEGRWPGLIKEGLDEAAMYCIAVVGDGDLPHWPSIGLSMPTHNNAPQAIEAITALSKSYPGTLHFAVVSNGCDEPNLAELRKLAGAMPYMMKLIEEPENRGFAIGCNLGLDHLAQEGWYDYFGVTNDDILPSTDCLCELVTAFAELERLGHKPGVIGPVSNNVHGSQRVEIGSFGNYAGMMYLAEQYHREHHSSATQVAQLRGLFMLIHPDCLSEVGGFDPRFGLGNFEDDDHNLRTRLAGYTIWKADGAFLFHHGSSTFKKLQVDYAAGIERNAEIMMQKWGLASIEEWISLPSKPDGVDLFVPLTARREVNPKFQVKINNEVIDLVNQASDVEFAAWVMNTMRRKPRTARQALVEALVDDRISA